MTKAHKSVDMRAKICHDHAIIDDMPLTNLLRKGGETMKTEQIKVSYRDKETKQNVSLGTVDAPRFDSTAEAVEYFEAQEAGKGEELCLDYIHTALDIELQRQHREANRPDRTKSQSATTKFRQLSPELQERLLKEAGVL